MNFFIGNPALIPLAALVSLPVLIHFFARARPRIYRFSSIDFLQKIVKETARLKRPRSWLLLILRTLLVAALILLFLKPILRSDAPLADALARKNVIILVDASASMSAIEGGGTRFATARAKAGEILSGLTGQDGANVIWMRSPTRPVFPVLGVNKSALQDALRDASTSSEVADVRGAFALAVQQLKDTEGAREIFVISDFQQSNWEDFRMTELPGIRMTFIPVAEEPVANQALTGIFTGSSRPLRGQPVEILCEVANFSAEPALRRIYLRAGSAAESREVRLPPFSTSSVGFLCSFDQAGEQVVSISLDEDAFPGDNERHAVVDVRSTLRVAITGHDPGTREVWDRALKAIEWVRIESADAYGSDLDAIFLGGWDGSGLEKLLTARDQGTTVICFPAPGCPPAALNSLFRTAGSGGGEAGRISRQVEEPPVRLRIADLDHPVFKIFNSGEFGDPAAGLFHSRLLIPPLPGSAHVLMAYEDGQPALARIPGNGHALGPVWLWNLALGPEDSDWGGRMELVPLVGEILLTGSGQGALKHHESEPGLPLRREISRDVLPEEVQVVGRNEKALPVRPVQKGAGGIFATEGVVSTGVYRWMLQDKSAGFSVVNFPTVESDLRHQSPSALSPNEENIITLKTSVNDLRDGIPLWPWMLGLVVLCAAAEGVVLTRSSPA